MRGQRLKRELTRLQSGRDAAEVRPDHRDELETALLARYRARRSRTRRWLMLLDPWNRKTRFALTGLALMVLGVTACTTSTTTEVEMGQKMTIGFTAEVEADVITIDTGLENFLHAQPGIEDVSVNIDRGPDGRAVIEVLAWGRDLDPDALAAELRRQVPELEGAEISFAPLSGELEESFASRLKREVFQLEVDGATAEEIRRKILDGMEAEGVDAEVEVTKDEGRTKIEIKVEETDDGR